MRYASGMDLLLACLLAMWPVWAVLLVVWVVSRIEGGSDYWEEPLCRDCRQSPCACDPNWRWL